MCPKLSAERTAKDTMAVTTQGIHGTHLILAELGPAQGLVAAGARADLGRHAVGALEEDRFLLWTGRRHAGIDQLSIEGQRAEMSNFRGTQKIRGICSGTAYARCHVTNALILVAKAATS